MARRADPFDWSGGHPALDFVNTLDERPSDAPVENLATYGDLVRFAELAGLIEPSASKRLQSLKGPACTRIAKTCSRAEGTPARDPGCDATSGSPCLKPRWMRSHRKCVGLTQRERSSQLEHRALVRHCWLSPSSPEIPLHACALAVEDFARHCRSQSNPKVRRVRLRRLFHRHEQGAPTAVVQHAELRQSRKTKALARGSRLKRYPAIARRSHMRMDRAWGGPVFGAVLPPTSSSRNRCGSSRHSLTRTRKVTASLPSTMRWS